MVSPEAGPANERGRRCRRPRPVRPGTLTRASRAGPYHREGGEAIRTRRTHKSFAPEPPPRELLDELLDLARWLPNPPLTKPWRFRVVGPGALAALKRIGGPEAAAKLDRAP